jgi:sugar/nucleoside kinase (ribokinase family)
MTARLIQLSGVILDMVYHVEAIPAPGTEAVVNAFSVEPGGGYNVMIAARRMGMDVIYAGSLGSGPFADMVARVLEGAGIPSLRRRLTGIDQGCCTVLVDRSGERTFIASEGADGVVSIEDLEQVRPGREDWLTLSGYALGYRRSREALTEWIPSLTSGGRLVFDPSPFVSRIPVASLETALSVAGWVTANASEAAWLTGLATPADSAAALAEARRGGAVVRDGANGCFVATPGAQAVHHPGHRVHAVDTNGAGDTHVGAFVAALARGEGPDTAAALANVAAALSTERRGPSTAPTLAETRAALEAVRANLIPR